MKRTRKARLTVALVALFTLGLSACNGGGSKGEAPASPERDEPPTATPAAGIGISLAPTDRSYAAALCGGSLSFQTAVEKSLSGARADASTSGPSSAVVAAITTAFAEFTGAVERAAPPPDFRQFHGDLATRLRETLERLKADPASAARAAVQSPIPAPPPELRERLAVAAAAERSCQAAGLTFR